MNRKSLNDNKSCVCVIQSAEKYLTKHHIFYKLLAVIAKEFNCYAICS